MKKVWKLLFCTSILFIFQCLFVNNACAQQPSVSKQINQIKRNPLYLYEEATHENAAEAESMAYELLMQRVNEYIASKGRLRNANNVLVKDIKQKGEVLSMMRGTMYRVFVYVLKSDIEGVSNTTVINSGSGTTVTVSDSPQTIVEVQTGGESGIRNEESGIRNEELGMRNEELGIRNEESGIRNEESRVRNEETEKRTENPVSRADESTGGDVNDAEASHRQTEESRPTETVASPLSGWQKGAIEGLLDCSDKAAVRAKLNRLKAEYKVKRYGTPDNCPSADAAWWAFFSSSGELVAILGPASPQRIDYKKMQYATLNDYKGMDALWFTLAK